MKKLLWLIPLIIVLYLLPAPELRLIDLVPGTKPIDAKISWPFLRYLCEPWAGPGEYLLHSTRYILQLVSWIGWIGAFFLTIGFLRRKNFFEILKHTAFAWLVFLTIVVFYLLLPLPAPSLVLPDNYTATDFHSHTQFSHDGVPTLSQSLGYHQSLGFNSFFVTEHGHTASFLKYPDAKRLSTVFPGMQVVTPERISLLVLADRPFDGSKFLHKPIKDVIDLAHREGFIAVCPHWWKWGQPPWEELYKAGIDGFEVYNAGYRNFPEYERANLIRFCRERGLLTMGSTDWHGWGRMSNVWTVFESDTQNGHTASSLFDTLRQHRPLHVLVYERAERNDFVRYFFEPFFGLYYYFGGMNLRQLLGWVFWIVVFAFLAAFRQAVYWTKLFSFLFGSIFLVLSVYYAISWIPLLPENQILGKLLVPILATLCVSWFGVWFTREE